MRRRAGAGAGLALLMLGWPASIARAEVFPTAQAVAANAAWLAYAPPPPQPASVCLVDTGVNLNADTAGAVLVRDSLDHGTPDDVDMSTNHGTRMAMVMAAPENGVGMVGVWPALRIVSVRIAGAVDAGTELAFPLIDYERTIRRCLDEPGSPRVVELALASGQQASPSERARLSDALTRAHAAGVNVVAAAGNDGGAVGTPASVPGIFAVGASDDLGTLCTFSSRGVGLALTAPGCHIDTADPHTLADEVGTIGTSQASALAAAVLASVRAYDPSISWSDAEHLLRQTARAGALDSAAAFRADSLGDIVDQAVADMPPSASAESEPRIGDTSASDGSVSRLSPARPHVTRMRYRRGVLTVVVAKRPPETFIRVIIQRWLRRGFKTVRTVQRNASTVRVHCSRPTRVLVRYVNASGGVSPSWVAYPRRR